MALSSFAQSGLSRVVTRQVPWAVVNGAPTGSYTSSGVTYNYWSFTGNGTLTINTAGWIDCLVVGGGGGGAAYGANGGAGGGGGCVRWGAFEIASGSHTVTIGAGGAAATDGAATSLGTVLLSGGGALGYANTNRRNGEPGGGGSPGGQNGNDPNQSHRGAGQGGTLYGTGGESGVTRSYSGSSVEYGSAIIGSTAGAANTGQGAGWRSVAGGSGIVIVRVAI